MLNIHKISWYMSVPKDPIERLHWFTRHSGRTTLAQFTAACGPMYCPEGGECAICFGGLGTDEYTLQDIADVMMGKYDEST